VDIVKAIIPAAGLGTRFLPITKAIPKELLPLINIPALQYSIQEGVASHIKQFSLIVSRGKQAITSYFDPAPCLESFLKEKGKDTSVHELNKLISQAQFTYVYQNEPLGLGHAISLAEPIINKEYFGVFLPDDIFVSKTPGLAQLMQIARQERASVIAVQEVPLECVSSYGVVAIKKQITPNLYQVSHLIEKPSIEQAPTNLAIVGRYILSHKIFHSLDTIRSHSTEGELQITDAIDHMIKQNEKVFAYKIQGTRYDIGTPVGWLKANISLALQNPEYAPHIKEYLANIDSLDSFLYNPEKNISHMV
jgi:UTP--glucose-1-phosphate uridylyltransferase